MKKHQVSGRTCPHCLVITDPVCYGWHVGKCSSRKLAQDMAPGTPIKNEVAGNSHFVEAPIHVPSPRDTPTFSPDFQILKGGRLPSTVQSLDSSKEELHHLREENQALMKDLKHKFEENESLNDKLKDLELILKEKQALTNKVKNLELKLEDLEHRLKLSAEAEKKALCLLESLSDSSREKNKQGNEEGMCGQPTQSCNVKDLGPDGCSGAGPGDSDSQFFHKQVEVVANVKERDVTMDSANSHDLDKRLDLDHIVDLACGEGAMSHGFLSHVEGVIKAKEALPSIINTSRKQRILSGAWSNVRNEDDNRDIAQKSGNPCSAKLGVPNLRNEFSPREIPHEDQHFASRTSNQEVPFMSSAPRDAIGTQCLRKDINNRGCATGLQADGHMGAKTNGNFPGKTSDCMREVGANWPEMQHHAVDTSLYAEKEKSVASVHVSSEKESDLNAKQIIKTQLHSSSVSAESDINVIKAKPGFRRMVLQSDSESESGNIQGIHSRRDTRQAHLCDSKQNALPPMSSDAEGEKSDQSSVVLRVVKNMCTSGKASQPHLRRSKRLNMVCISDQSDEVFCKGETEQNNHRSAEARRIAATDLEGVGVDGIRDEEHAGVRRSKRLRKMSIQNPKNSLQKERVNVEMFSSSGDETSGNREGSEVSESEASSIPSAAFKTQVKRKGPSRTRKRLFEEDESRPLYGNKHSTDSEEDDSEIESDADSLRDFITDSEGRESSQSSHEDHSSSSSYSSREVYHDPRHKRDIKIKNYVWELEGEMLSMLAIDPKLCLRAVCALNRRQTEDEQKDKISKYTNKRGFDKLHAARGSRLAEFLTDGDVSGPMKKSLEDLDKFDAGGLQFCKMLASKHSKQLFEMYTNAEDPHFPFS